VRKVVTQVTGFEYSDWGVDSLLWAWVRCKRLQEMTIFYFGLKSKGATWTLKGEFRLVETFGLVKE